MQWVICLVWLNRKKKENAMNMGVGKTSCVWMDHHNLGRSHFLSSVLLTHHFFMPRKALVVRTRCQCCRKCLNFWPTTASQITMRGLDRYNRQELYYSDVSNVQLHHQLDCKELVETRNFFFLKRGKKNRRGAGYSLQKAYSQPAWWRDRNRLSHLNSFTCTGKPFACSLALL